MFYVADVRRRYGDEDDTRPSDRLMSTMFIPSRVLERNNLEILVSSYNTGSAAAAGLQDLGALQDAVLVPPLHTPTSSTGRYQSLTYPVHKAVLFGDGLEKCLILGKYLDSVAKQDLRSDMVHVALGLPAPESPSNQRLPKQFSVIDVKLAEDSLALFRQSTSNSIAYERGWFRSGLPSVSSWFTPPTSSSSVSLKLEVANLVSSVLLSTTTALIEAETEALEAFTSAASVSVPDSSTRRSLLNATAVWAELAHSELRDGLDIAFDGRPWRKLAWWKLFWRVDDVSMILSDLVSRRFLTEAEKNIIWVAGRMDEAGLLEGTHAPLSKELTQVEPLPAAEEDRHSPPAPLMLPPPRDDENATRPILAPWPQQIPSARYITTAVTIPALQSLAQRLVLQTLSTVTLTSTLGSLMYITGNTAYQAGAVAALGAVLALARMQKVWEREREKWMGEVRESGRLALKETEKGVRISIMRQRETAQVEDPVLVEERRMAREALENAAEQLHKLRP